MEFFVKIIGGVVLVMMLLIAAALLGGVPTYYLWNGLMPEIFALKAITFWQAVGLNLLAGILFKSHSGNSK